MESFQKYNEWLHSSFLSFEDKNELLSISNNDIEINERFHKDLEFGTGGLRGIIGIGTNRINSYTIKKASYGFASYINNKHQENPLVIIAYDSRRFSEQFAYDAAEIFSSFGIKVELFPKPCPTPILSYAIRNRKASGGVVITASHNPPEYNGYKTYDENGCQMIPDKANLLIHEIKKINNLSILSDIVADRNLIGFIPESVLDDYYKYTRSLLRINDYNRKLPVTFTALHGSSGTYVNELLKSAGFENIYIVESQFEPNGDFPTIKSPNPEDKDAFEIALKEAKLTNSELVIACDPDGDRVGLYYRHQNNYKTLTGNQIGALLIDFILKIKQLPKNPVLVKTIVTSELGAKIALSKGIKTIDTLTGFKYIGDMIHKFESEENNFLFGYEESYGYLTGTEVRDKDAVLATYLLTLMVAYYSNKGLTIQEVIDNIERKYGYFTDGLYSLTLKGIEGNKKIFSIMEYFRNQFNSHYEKIDYQYDNTNLPKENVLKFKINQFSWFAIRPSGTEPKLKVYFSVFENDRLSSNTAYELIYTEITSQIQSLI